MNPKAIGLRPVITKLGEYGRKLQPYTLIAFVLFAAALYGFVLLQINALSNQEPTEDAINTQVKTAKLSTIDPAVVKQLQTLQDRSVSVSTLFEDARNNPF
jgi:hypothetical protein